MIRTFTTQIGANPIAIEAGKLAGQAGGAVTVRSGDTVILATATCSKEAREETATDFVPLVVDYQERLYAAGRIPGSFFRREGRPSEEAILLCRLIDRSVRPLIPKGFPHEIQVIVTALSADQENYLDILAIIGASAALTISDIPFAGPIGAARVGYISGEFIFNPTASQMEVSTLNLRMAATRKAIVMLEGEGQEVAEELVGQAAEAGFEALQSLIKLQEEMQRQIDKPAKREFSALELDPELCRTVQERLDSRVGQLLGKEVDKEERAQALDALRRELAAELGERFEEKAIGQALDQAFKARMRSNIMEKSMRADGRGLSDIRPISAEVGLLPRTHGSALFNRGQTQVLTIATLGMVSEEKPLDSLEAEEAKRFMHHYNFPPYSTGEAAFLRGPGRREIGHGALAERALLLVVPGEEQFPYTVRLVSEVLSSDGSTSMASVCASSLCLMDAGVPIKRPVAGIAMGLVKEGTAYRLLTDIQGLEDFLGDMDFKVAGTDQGITALQLDLKIEGLDFQILREALARAREARLFVLERMNGTMSQPRSELSPHAPRIIMIKINPEKIGAVIGTGGKTIRKIEALGVKIDLEDDGTVFVSSTDRESTLKAVDMIQSLTEEAEVGKIYTGTVKRIDNFGAFVEILPGQDGLVHISQLADYPVSNVRDVVRLGDQIMVMVTDIDREGKIRLSRRAVLEGWSLEEARAKDQGVRRRTPSSTARPRGSGSYYRPRRPPQRDKDDRSRTG